MSVAGIARRALRARWMLLVVLQLGAGLPVRADVVAIDDAGVRVALAQPARRIVALAPHVTELLFAAGAGAYVVGVVAGSDFPPQAPGIAIVGDANAVDLERIVALKPDLVVTWPYTTSAQLAAIGQRGIAVFTSNARTIDAIAGDVERLGDLAGTRDVALRAAAAFRADIAASRRGTPGEVPLRVFYEIWGEPIFTVGGAHLISEAITLCGGENVFAALSVAAPVVSKEAVIAARPQVIVAGADDAKRPAWLDAWRRWPEIPAVRDDRLRVVDANLLHRAGPRFARGVAQLCAALRP
ncbi:MAG: cobalamin-binding protein [Betaproteobacteria bacterium]